MPQQCGNVVVALRYTLYWRENGLTAITVTRTTANITVPGESHNMPHLFTALQWVFLCTPYHFSLFLFCLPSSIFDQKILCSVCEWKWNISVEFWQSRLKELPRFISLRCSGTLHLVRNYTFFPLMFVQVTRWRGQWLVVFWSLIQKIYRGPWSISGNQVVQLMHIHQYKTITKKTWVDPVLCPPQVEMACAPLLNWDQLCLGSTPHQAVWFLRVCWIWRSAVSWGE